MFWINGLETELLVHSLYLGHLLRKKERIHCFVGFITMSSTLLRIVGPFTGFFTKKFREGTLELTQREPEVQRNPLPNHKGKGVVAMVIHGNPAEAEEFEVRRIATESLMSIVADSRVECFIVESHVSRAYLETTNAITFTDEGMEVEHPDYRRPFYLMATINGVQIRRALVGTEASLNLLA